MTAFIRQEALEKAKEIQIKADEEFAIEKSKLVRAETASIDSEYEKKFKQAGMSQQITRSTMANKTRLKVLTARQELLDELFEKAREKLADSANDKEAYGKICKDLILEGSYALNEEKLAVRARKADHKVVEKAIEEAREEYKDKTKKDIKIKLDEENELPEESYANPSMNVTANANTCRAGGVSVLGGGGKIDINNTLEERLKLLEVDALPMVRVTLFGKNENRRFED